MIREQSDKTQLRTLRAENKRLRAEVNSRMEESRILRGRMNKAEADTSEWKRRFDLLLERTPKSDTCEQK